MSEERVEVPMAGVAMTAIGVAIIRAWESERADRLYDDPLAWEFVAAARGGFESVEGGAQRWARVEALAEQFFEGRTTAVRAVDDEIARAVGEGCAQIVVLGAGLDTRAYRMALPPEIVVFELDLPELFAFKEPVLAAAGARPTCARRVVPVDLRGDWDEPLRAAGFRADVRTQWVDEGVLGYLARTDALRLVERLTELSAPGSIFGLGRFDVDSQSDRYTALRQLVRGEHGEPLPEAGLGPDGERWLAEHGWATRFESWEDLVAGFARSEVVYGPGVGIVRAVHRS
ncbi:SAM-dependent methyltransferase [Nocardia arizonensis]|uniref:SAM-dependent methyltransferase n=1 Tax=Nocardia arizonensis TaxID=1141647 RepID=UPI000A9885BD|nr:SAM-dependent methyltransferase [Nocardia arizonensis]